MQSLGANNLRINPKFGPHVGRQQHVQIQTSRSWSSSSQQQHLNKSHSFAHSSSVPSVSFPSNPSPKPNSQNPTFRLQFRRPYSSMSSTDVLLTPPTSVKMDGSSAQKNATLICAPIMADSVDQMLANLAKAKSSGADLVEIRLDTLKTFSPQEDINTLIKGSALPTLFTYRPKWEGGQYEGDEESRLDALRLAMELGADYVDVELKNAACTDVKGLIDTEVVRMNTSLVSLGTYIVRKNLGYFRLFIECLLHISKVATEFNDSIREKSLRKCKIIISSHNYENTPSVEELGKLVAKIQSAGADIVKIATTASDITDVARMFHITAHSQVPVIGIVMGERGLMSRVLSAKFGSFLTFATLESGIVSAPGQPTIKDLLDLYNFRSIGPDTKVYGIIGKPVGHSKSPILYNEAFKAISFNGVYVHLLVDDISSFFRTYSSTDFAGFSVTIPHKEAAVNCCDEVDPVAESIGAINLVVRRESDGKLFGYNTDYVGAITAIEDGLRGSKEVTASSNSPLKGKLFIVIGAGGAGKALAYGAKMKGARVVIANRTYDRARELAEVIGGNAISLADLATFHPEDGMVLANTTSIGMQPKVDETPIPKQTLKHYTLVFDAVYTPRLTRLLREAEECGATIVSGAEMFIGQAYEQYERFTSLPAPKELFRKIMAKY